MKPVASRSVFVTGASSGLGKALTEVFSERGDTVIAVARKKDRLRKLADTLRARGKRCTPVVCDVRNEQQIRNAVNEAFRRIGKIDVLINNAGITSFKTFLRTSPREFREILATNLTGLFLVTRSVLSRTQSRRPLLILNILSYAALTTYTGSSAYSASKAGGAAMMKSLREEMRGGKVKIVNIYPGAVLTPMWQKRHRRKYGARMMDPREVAELIYGISVQPSGQTVEEIILRPPTGDLKV